MGNISLTCKVLSTLLERGINCHVPSNIPTMLVHEHENASMWASSMYISINTTTIEGDYNINIYNIGMYNIVVL